MIKKNKKKRKIKEKKKRNVFHRTVEVSKVNYFQISLPEM